MKVKLQVEKEKNADGEEDKKSRLFMKIYKAFPNAIWEREGEAFLVFI